MTSLSHSASLIPRLNLSFFLLKNMIAYIVKATGCNVCEPYRESVSEEQEKGINVTDTEQVYLVS